MNWAAGPGTAPIGEDLAEIDLSEEYLFLDREGTIRFMEVLQNPTNGSELATITPRAENENWFVIFEWDPIGYVPDDEKDSLNHDSILESIRAGTEEANKLRAEQGWATIQILGWHERPHYEATTNNLTWSILGETEGHRVINRTTKLLGRRGVMTATLVAGPDELEPATRSAEVLLADYRFRPGSTYAEYLPGTDTLAEVGLTALIVGGAGATLVKTGLLARFWKILVAGGVALLAGLRKLFKRGSTAPV